MSKEFFVPIEKISLNNHESMIDNFPQPEQVFHGNGLAEKILFACIQCSGALVPISYCIVCKKTILRKCVKCEIVRDFGFHDSCKQLVFISSEFGKHASLGED